MYYLLNFVKLQEFLRDVAVRQVCNLNSNYSITFHKCSGKKILLNVHQKMFLLKCHKTFSCPCLFTHSLLSKKAVPLGQGDSRGNTKYHSNQYVVVGRNGERTSQLMFYVAWGFMERFSEGFLISISLPATDLKCLIKNLIFNSLKFK